MSAHTRIEQLRAVNPAAVELAVACALAARVEPDLLRRLRLLIPRADAAAEADLWFSDLLAGRDATAITLDPPVAENLRAGLRNGDDALREAAATEIASRHAGAHWSIRLEERIHYLDTARPPDADEEIDNLLLAALEALRTEPDPRGIARWLLGAAGRFPRQVSERTAGRASAAAAALHLDRQAPPSGLLGPGESQAWLPWLAQSLPQVSVGVALLDGAVVLGADGPDIEQLAGVPDTDPLVIEVRWNDGTRTGSELARFRPGEPVQIETGTRAVTLITLTGTTYDLMAADTPMPAGLNFDHRKRTLRPCLAREKQLAELRGLLTAPSGPTWIGISGRPGSGVSTLLVAATDSASAVIEHFFGQAPGLDEPAVVYRSCLAQLEACYPEEFADRPARETDVPDLSPVFEYLAGHGAFARRPLVLALDGPLEVWPVLFPATPPAGVHFLVATDSLRLPGEQKLRTVGLTRSSDRAVCLAMIERHRAELERAYLGPLDQLPRAADDLPGRLARILAWIKRQPPASVTAATIPAPLTTEWPRVREGFTSLFGREQAEILFDILRAAAGRHTWEDCAEAADAAPDVEDGIWPRSWDACREANLVVDTPPDGIVELTEPSIANELLADDRPGDRCLGVRHESPVDFARTASPTRLAAAVTHALATDDLTEAHRLCTELPVLRRRYAEDPQGLLADLDAVAAAESDEAWVMSQGSTDPEPLAPDLMALRAVVAGLAKDGVPPAAFAAALSDRLVERGATRVLSLYRAAMAPLRVRQVFDEPELRTSTPSRKITGPVLAIAEVGEAEPMLVTATHSLAGPGTEPAIGAARAGSRGFAAWSRTSAWTDQIVPVEVRPIDHAVRIPNGIAVAGPDGTVTVVSGGTWRLAGHGARVTDIIAIRSDRPWDVLAASEDGTVRRLARPGEAPLVYSGHRGPVRCLTKPGVESFVSGGDDGCLLLWHIDDPTQPVARWHSDAAITCLDTTADNTILFGTSDGRVESWDPINGTSTLLGRHDDPVRGVTYAWGTVVSWADSVRFWEPLPGRAIGFPGGVRDVLVGEGTYTVLCGDGSVQQRPRPGPATDSPERACLAVADQTVYTGLDNALIRVSPDGTRESVLDGGPFVQAASTRHGVAVRDSSGRSTLVGLPDLLLTSLAETAELIAGHPGGPVFGSANQSIIFLGGGKLAAATIPPGAPDQIISLAAWPESAVAGLANGETFLSDGRILPGDGQPATAVAALPDGSVLTGTSAGDVRHWPGPTRFPLRGGAITAMAVAGPWVLAGGMDGIVALWATDPPRPVHGIDLGAPVLAIAAEPGLAAARDAHGRLWMFDLDTPQSAQLPLQLTVSWTPATEPGTGAVLTVAAPAPEPYELTAIRVSAGGQPMPVAVRGAWPVLEPDGSFTVPVRPLPNHPLRFGCPLPSGTDVMVTVDIAGPYVPGYRRTITLGQEHYAEGETDD